MKKSLKNFFAKLTEDDFKGSATKLGLQKKAEMFLGSVAYAPYETIDSADTKGLDIHNALLCLIYDAI